MSSLELKNISKSFGLNRILDNISFKIKENEFFSIVGPSGCGKTTLLRIISGLEFPDSGKAFLNETDLTGLPPQKRNIGIVFQNYALFPHMTVFENISFGLKIKKKDSNEIKDKVEKVLSVVKLSNKKDENVSSLSGGEQQRVSLARVIVMQPGLILFDEPLSNLDYALRVETRNELKRLRQEIGITSVYVTHDQSEALALSDRLAVMNNGIIQQIGSPHEIYYSPVNYFVADFIGHANLFTSKEAAEVFNINNLDNENYLAILPEELEIISDKNSRFFIEDIQFTGSVTEFAVNVNGKLFRSSRPSLELSERFELNGNVSLNNKNSKPRIVNKTVNIS